MEVYVLLLLTAMASVVSGKITNCNAEDPNVPDVHVSGCEGHDRCPLDRKGSVDITIDFKVDEPVESLIYAISGNLEIPGGSRDFYIPFQRGNACQSLGLTCPLQPDQEQHYNGSVKLQPMFPTIDVTVKYELMYRKLEVVCVKIPAKLV